MILFFSFFFRRMTSFEARFINDFGKQQTYSSIGSNFQSAAGGKDPSGSFCSCFKVTWRRSGWCFVSRQIQKSYLSIAIPVCCSIPGNRCIWFLDTASQSQQMTAEDVSKGKNQRTYRPLHLVRLTTSSQGDHLPQERRKGDCLLCKWKLLCT